MTIPWAWCMKSTKQGQGNEGEHRNKVALYRTTGKAPIFSRSKKQLEGPTRCFYTQICKTRCFHKGSKILQVLAAHGNSKSELKNWSILGVNRFKPYQTLEATMSKLMISHHKHGVNARRTSWIQHDSTHAVFARDHEQFPMTFQKRL